jgi:hypothetical protein
MIAETVRRPAIGLLCAGAAVVLPAFLLMGIGVGCAAVAATAARG